MASTGRSRGPASRPPRRPSATRSAGGASAGGSKNTARGGSARTPAGGSAGGKRPTGSAATPAASTGTGTGATTRSAAARSASSATGRTSTTGAPTTAKVVRRTRSGWRGRVGDAVTNRMARRAAVLVSIAVFLSVLLGSTVAAWLHQRGQISALQDRVATQEQDVAALRAEQERWSDPAYVEQQARQRLKFVKPGEKSYTVLDPATSKDVPITTPGVAQPKTVLPWYQSVWESARTADAPGAHR
jgi:cell division protein FtsB